MGYLRPFTAWKRKLKRRQSSKEEGKGERETQTTPRPTPISHINFVNRFPYHCKVGGGRGVVWVSFFIFPSTSVPFPLFNFLFLAANGMRCHSINHPTNLPLLKHPFTFTNFLPFPVSLLPMWGLGTLSPEDNAPVSNPGKWVLLGGRLG